ncbi:MAG TPA: hypothetical protein VJ910_07295 [Desulfuromonadales bacterium]|nr:hypothetical protein [Desulfuromonadales bacterium]
MSDLEKILHNAIDHYRELREHLDRLQEAWQPGEARSLTTYLQRFEELQAVLVQTDLQLVSSLRASEDMVAHPEMKELQELMEDIARRIKTEMPGLLALKELVANELAQVRGNRSAIGNYQSRAEHRGNIVRSAF